MGFVGGGGIVAISTALPTSSIVHCIVPNNFSYPTHACGGTLDLLMTDVPDLVRVAVVAPIGNSDHSSLSAVIWMAQAVLNLCVSRKVSLNIKSIGILSVVQCGNCLGVAFGFLTILLMF